MVIENDLSRNCNRGHYFCNNGFFVHETYFHETLIDDCMDFGKMFCKPCLIFFIGKIGVFRS